MASTSLTNPTPATGEAPSRTSFIHRAVDLLYCPEEVMEQINQSPPSIVNWLVPTLIVWLVTFICSVPPDTGLADLDPGAAAAGHLTRLIAVGISTFIGTLWSACILRWIARWFLGARISYRKAPESVGFCGILIALSIVTTALLTAATGRASAHPSLALFLSEPDVSTKLYRVLDSIHVFHIWIALVLAVALSKLTRTTWGECAFWTLGYWVVLRAMVG
jgi:hypothetical protein